ncbi:hypothetical protein [Virgibacillus salexigens]|uniref:Uncharacterized protein n=1 Tax=Virgibacillus massiliensis TaxID=1462526 RepID=A0A024QIG1_9BACI|nr:hypothetical protein [Virgibacillus massiliensis]CDQ41751.1 hypothetical protein BN990_04128 [Virgibacillus massiliensis]
MQIKQELTTVILTSSANFLRVALCIGAYYKFGMSLSLGLVLFFILNKLTAIEKGIYDNENKLEEMKNTWNPISKLRKPI